MKRLSSFILTIVLTAGLFPALLTTAPATAAANDFTFVYYEVLATKPDGSLWTWEWEPYDYSPPTTPPTVMLWEPGSVDTSKGLQGVIDNLPLPVLSEETERRLIGDYRKHEAWIAERTVSVAQYYGAYSGCEVALIGAENRIGLTVIANSLIAGYLFVCGTGGVNFPIVHKDSEFLYLWQAYDAGWLTDDDIKDIWLRYMLERYTHGSIVGEPNEPTANTTSADPVLVPSTTPDTATINLTAETIALGSFKVGAYSLDGGRKWKTGALPTGAKFSKLFNKELTLWLAEGYDKKAKAATGTEITFPTIQARPKRAIEKPGRLSVWYAFDPDTKTPSWFIADGKSADKAPLLGIYETTTTAKGAGGYTMFAQPSTDMKPGVTHFIRTPAKADGTTYTPASRAARVRTAKPTKDITLRERNGAVQLRKGWTYRIIKGNTPDAPIALTAKESVAFDTYSSIEVWTTPGRRPASKVAVNGKGAWEKSDGGDDPVEYVTVTFQAGANGTLIGETTAQVPKGGKLKTSQIPSPIGNGEYGFVDWVNGTQTFGRWDLLNLTINEEITFTAVFDVYTSTTDDFTLTITVDETTLPQGEDFTVNVELKNNSGKDVEIVYTFFFFPDIQGWHLFGDRNIAVKPPYPELKVFEADSVIENERELGRTLKPGKHELRFKAWFWLQDDIYELPWEERVEVWSNKVILNVTKDDTPRDDFELTITIDETTVTSREGFKVNVELKNNTGEDVEIVHGFLLMPFIPYWHISHEGSVSWAFADPTQLHSRLFKANGVLQNIGFLGDEIDAFVVGASLDQGTYELQFRAVFYLNWGEVNQERVEVWSNTVMLTVLERDDTPRDDFTLTISAEETISPYGDDFKVNVELKNNSGENVEIASYALFYPGIPQHNWRFESLPPLYPHFEFFENDTISEYFYLKRFYDLPKGTYQLSVEARFYLDWVQPADPANEPKPWKVPDNAREIKVVSNTVTLTVE
jgi:hypothetical protein